MSASVVTLPSGRHDEPVGLFGHGGPGDPVATLDPNDEFAFNGIPLGVLVDLAGSDVAAGDLSCPASPTRRIASHGHCPLDEHKSIRVSLIVDNECNPRISLNRLAFDRGAPRREDEVVTVEHEPDWSGVRPTVGPNCGELGSASPVSQEGPAFVRPHLSHGDRFLRTMARQPGRCRTRSRSLSAKVQSPPRRSQYRLAEGFRQGGMWLDEPPHLSTP